MRSLPFTRKNLVRYRIYWWQHPVGSGILALTIYAAIAASFNPTFAPTLNAYFNYLADAFLHGQLNLRLIPPTTHDLVYFGGQYFLYWPPLPALLLLPFVAVFGVNFSDVLFTVVVGALNVALMSVLLHSAQRRGLIDLTPTQRSWLVMFFALGTVHITLTPFGRVWFVGQLVALTCVLLTYLAALRLEGLRAFVLVGFGVGATFLTRNHMAFAGLWPLVYLVARHRSSGWRRLLGGVMASAMPALGAVLLFGIYNYLRFGNFFDVGVNYHLMDPNFVDEYRQYGLLSIHYLPVNFFYQYIAYPLPYNPQTFAGGGLFWLSPLWSAAVWGAIKGRPRWSAGVLVVTVGLVAVPILLLMGTGWEQFGPRYTLDFSVPLMLLTALGIRRWPLQVIVLLTLLSIVQFSIGMLYWGKLMMAFP